MADSVIQFICPECGEEIEAPSLKAGTTGRCPLCATVVLVPVSGVNAEDIHESQIMDWLGVESPTSTKDDVSEAETKVCPFCAETILRDAVKCRYCGEFLDARSNRLQHLAGSRTVVRQSNHPGIAAVLSFVIPGLGQIYNGHILIGLIWLICCMVLYFLALDGHCVFIPVALLVHIVCILRAYSGAIGDEGTPNR